MSQTNGSIPHNESACQAPIDIFQEVREHISALDVARAYGLEFDAHGRAKCPFHDDKHPSMSFKNGRWRCWTCGIGGSSIDLVMRLFGLDAKGAIQKLNADFNLKLPIGRPMTVQESAEAKKRRELAERHKAFEDWRETLERKCLLAWQIGRDINERIRTGEDERLLTPQEIFAWERREWVDYIRDILIFGTPEEQAGVWRDRREVESCIEKILHG